MTRRLTTTQRRALYAAAVDLAHGEGLEHPACNLCPHPILPGQLWDASHDPRQPGWLSGEKAAAIAHRRCNRLWNARHDTPLFAKNNRQRDKLLDIKRARNPLPGGRDDPRKRSMSGRVVERASGRPWHLRVST